jgi:hypothetical protein
MFRGPGQWRERIESIAQKFREKGATSPESAMTAQELGLPPRFEEAMKRRLGQTGIFVDVGGRYYLNEERLATVEQRGQGMARGGRRQNMLPLRMARMIIGVLIVFLILIILIYGRIFDLLLLTVGLIVIWIGLSIYQIFYLARVRSSRNAL